MIWTGSRYRIRNITTPEKGGYSLPWLPGAGMSQLSNLRWTKTPKCWEFHMLDFVFPILLRFNDALAEQELLQPCAILFLDCIFLVFRAHIGNLTSHGSRGKSCT